MYPSLTRSLNSAERVFLHKINSEGTFTIEGAFSISKCPQLRLTVPRTIGVTKVFLQVHSDLNNRDDEYEFSFQSTAFGKDIYVLADVFSPLCAGEGYGLLYYTVRLERGFLPPLFSTTSNNVDMEFTEDCWSAGAFRMLVYKDGFTTPDWAKSAVMYQVFVDRFCKGSVEVPCRSDAVINPDWENGIPEYAENQGDELKNNTFFGGTLYGLVEKLDYLNDLGVTCIYLNPIFKAFSNHKYDTGNYEEVDEMFGGDTAFDLLVKEADCRGIKIILDGVFNHTGDDSKYFNRYGKYDSVGAYQSPDSPYHNWYYFNHFPEDFQSWWGIKILPKLNNTICETREYFLGKKGIVRKWLEKGVSGWRLDVADELPQDFLEDLRGAVKSQNPDALIIGEVWENAADKISYSQRRRYFLGDQVDSVMNYPIKEAIIDFVKNGNSQNFYDKAMDTYSGYPPQCRTVLMNILGTHDTERILTVLAGESSQGKTNRELSTAHLSPDEKTAGIKLLKCASVLQFTLPGMPNIFYGDEAGLEGYHDPFCRRPFPWGREDGQLTDHYKKLAHIKLSQKALSSGGIRFLDHRDGLIVFERGSHIACDDSTFENSKKSPSLLVIVNCGKTAREIHLGGTYTDLLTGATYGGPDGSISVDVVSAHILVKN